MTMRAPDGQGGRPIAPARSAPFTGLDRLEPSARRALLSVCATRRYPRGAEVVCQGDEWSELHLIVRGHVSVHRTASAGGTYLLAVLGPGAAYGHPPLVDGPRRMASVLALDDLEVSVLAAEAFEAVREREPAVDRFLVELLAWQADLLRTRLTESAEVPADRRVLRRVVELADAFADDGCLPVVIPVSQEDVAGLAGVTRPTANRVLQAASQQRLLSLGWRRIVVADPARLADAAYGEDAAC